MPRDALLVAEVADALAQHGRLRCVLQLDHDDEGLLVTLQVPSGVDGMQVLALRDELQYVFDVATLRAIADRYGIDPATLEKWLAKEG